MRGIYDQSGIDSLAFIILVSVFAASLTIASVLAAKIITIAGISVPAGVIAYCLTFICTDVISEVWGRQRAGQVVLAGFISLVFVLLLIELALYLPATSLLSRTEAFETTLSSTPRIILASLAAYLASQFHDVWSFHFIRKMTAGRHLWLRNNISTAVSQLLDSVVFITIAFYGHFSVLPLIVGQWTVKMGIALVDTAVVYLLVWLIRNKLSSAVCSG